MPSDCCKQRWERLMVEEPDMPVFTLLAKDAIAIETVEFWMARAKELGVNPEKMAKVQEHLDAMKAYKAANPDKVKTPD